MGIMDNEGHDPMGFGNVRSASRELDIETLTRPGGIVPVDIHTTGELVRHVLRLRAALKDAREFVAGMVKPVTMPTTLTISSYHPCHALLDKIDAALGSTHEQKLDGTK